MSTVNDRVRGYFARYGIGLFILIHAFAGGGHSVKATEAALAELIASGHIAAQPWCGRRKLYRMLPKLAHEMGLGEHVFRNAPGPQKIIESLTIAHYCRDAGVELLTPGDLIRVFPELRTIKKFRRTRYFLTADDKLGLVVPDFQSNWKNVAKKARKEISERKGFEQFRKLIRLDMFRIALVTAIDSKAEILRHALADQSQIISVSVVPELFDLLGIEK